MNNTKLGIFLAFFIIALSWSTYLHYFKVPALEQTITRYENAPVKIDTLTITQLDTIAVIDTVKIRIPVVQPPVEVSEKVETYIKSYETAFEDTLIKGTIYTTIQGPGSLLFTNIAYKHIKPFYSYIRVDSVFTVKTITLPPKTIYKKDAGGLYLGAFVGAYPSASGSPQTLIGPDIGVATRKGTMFTYKYDIINGGHMVGIKRKITFPEKLSFLR